MEEIAQLIAKLEQEAASIQIVGRPLTIDEQNRLRAIAQAIPLLRQVQSLFPAEAETDNLITYKIVADLGGKLKTGACTACNFWNRFVAPRYPIVIRLGRFTEWSTTIARAWEPFMEGGTMYGRVEFNTLYLRTFDPQKVAGTVVHEIGHTLGFGWEDWMELFDVRTGRFVQNAVDRLEALGNMHVETDFGSGTRFSHWDEARYDRELMTGFQDPGEHVLPVTIDVMELLGHRVRERLSQTTALRGLLSDAAGVKFTRQAEAKALNLDVFEETEVFEEIPHAKS